VSFVDVMWARSVILTYIADIRTARMMVEEETTAEEETRDDPIGFHEVVVLSIGSESDCMDFGSTAVRQARRLAC
jgi:hypothetical protein